MFDLDTSIQIVGLVLVVVCVEYLPDWWHFIYVVSLIVPVFMIFRTGASLFDQYHITLVHIVGFKIIKN